MQIITIKGKLPSRNEADDAFRRNWSVGAKFKREHTELVAWECLAQRIKPAKMFPVAVAVTFYEKDMKRDADNIVGGGLKYILDGIMVQARIIPNDTRKHVRLYVNPVELDRQNPRIEIIITEAAEHGEQKDSRQENGQYQG